jgi:hypothetical protein
MCLKKEVTMENLIKEHMQLVEWNIAIFQKLYLYLFVMTHQGTIRKKADARIAKKGADVHANHLQVACFEWVSQGQYRRSI